MANSPLFQPFSAHLGYYIYDIFELYSNFYKTQDVAL